MIGFILGFLAGVITYPWVAPFILPLIDKVKGMFNKLDPEVNEKEDTESK